MLLVSRKPSLKIDTIANSLPSGFVRPMISDKHPDTSEIKSEQQSNQVQRQARTNALASQTIITSPLTSKPISPKQSIDRTNVLLPNRRTSIQKSLHTTNSSKILARLQRQPFRESNQNNSVVSNRSGRRSIDDFVKSQIAYSRRSAERLNNIKKEVEQKNTSNLTFKPKISDYPVTSKGRVHERLYCKGLESKFKKGVHYRHIELKKDEEETYRRQHHQDIFEYSTTNLTNISWSRPFTARTECQSSILMNEKGIKQNNRLIIRKLLKQIYESCERLKVNFTGITQVNFNHLMADMNFIGDRASLSELWCMIGHTQISVKRLAHIVCAIFGIHDITSIETMVNDSNFPYLKEPHFNEHLSKEIKAKFDCLYVSRLNSDRLSRTSKQLITYLSQKDLTFKPQISKKSRQLAQKHRQKQNNCNIERPSFLKSRGPNPGYSSATASSAKLRQVNLNESSQQLVDIDENLSPGITPERSFIHTYRNTNTARKSEAELFPNNERRVVKRDWKPFAGNIEKEIVRLIYARKKKNGLKPEVNKQCCGNKRPALVRLDIYIDEKQKHELVVHNEDEPEEVAKRFSNQFQISNSARERLSQLIMCQIHKATEK